jgi:chromosomal replication initiator protein
VYDVESFFSLPSNSSTPMERTELWKRVKDDLEVSISKAMFTMWIKPAEIIELKDVGEDRGIAVFSSPTPYHLSTLENRFYAQIKDALDRITGKKYELQFTMKRPEAVATPNEATENVGDPDDVIVEEIGRKRTSPVEMADTLFSQHETSSVPTTPPSAFRGALQRAGLREDYNFETFAVSSSNEMAHAAAQAVSQSPGTAYNPLFLYGGVGVGKTHLMQAIGNNILRGNPNISLAYTTGEQFTNEIVAAIQQKKTIQLKQKFRSYRVLLVDDIQFIAGKTSVQEEFFHTFNAIAPLGGQIVLTSDRPPHEMTLLEDRLRSRFEAGLIIDIQQPSFELRTAILLIKAKKIGLNLPMDLAQKIASAIDSPRKLEGILVKLHSAYTLFRKPITPELVEEILGKTEQVEFPKNAIKPTEVLKTVASQFHISLNSLRGPSRLKSLVEARHLCMYILYNDLGITFQEIGRTFDGRDHTSVMHAVAKMRESVDTNETLRTHLNAIKTSLSFQS